MGSFAYSIFSVLLGWIRGAVNQLWALLNSDSGGGFLAWIGENWKVLTLLLCGIGVVVDLVVYLFRWRPLRVWASFFRRLRGKGVEADEWQEETPPPAPAPREPAPQPVSPVRQESGRTWVYPDGTARMAEPYDPPAAQPVEPMQPQTAQDYYQQFARPEPAAAPMQFASMGRAYRRPRAASNLYVPEERPHTAPSMTGLEDYPQPQEQLVPYEPPMAEVVEPAAQEAPVDRSPRRMLQRVAKNLRDDEDELNYRYTPPAPAVDKQQAYHQPVYPPSWQPPQGAENANVKPRWRQGQ